MTIKVDPKIKGLSEESAAKTKQEQEQARAKDRERNLEQALRDLKPGTYKTDVKVASDRQKSTPGKLQSEGSLGKETPPALAGRRDFRQTETVTPRAERPAQKPDASSGTARREHASRMEPPKDGPRNIQASHFVAAPKPNPLAQLASVLKTQPPPARPPRQEEGMETKKGPVVETPVHEKLEPKVVVATPQSGQGKSVDIRDSEVDSPESFETEEEQESQESGESTSARTAATSHKGDGALGAASGGVGGGGGEQESILNKESGVQFLSNEDGKLEKDFVSVFESYSKLKRYVYQQLSPDQADKAIEVFEQALALNSDPTLMEILERGRAARLNPYGVFHG